MVSKQVKGLMYLSKITIIFPGQGSQYVGMGKDFYEKYESVKKIYKKADDILGCDLSKLIFEGPENELRITKHTQPAIVTTSVALWTVIQEELELVPNFMAGHSLGEYSALTASGNIHFEDSLNLVRKRGIFMDDASTQVNGTMAAVLGINREELQKICEYITSKGYVVQLANINSPNQIVISGVTEGIELAGKLAKEKGAKKIIPLSVSGPFHSVLMESAKNRLAPVVNEVDINRADVQVVMNVTGKPEFNELQIRNNLIEQVVSPVLWTDSIEWMIKNGTDTFIEVGPGKVLSGLVKKISDQVKIINIDNIESLTAYKEQVKVVN